jgi:hypothetical protein
VSVAQRVQRDVRQTGALPLRRQIPWSGRSAAAYCHPNSQRPGRQAPSDACLRSRTRFSGVLTAMSA